ncbi:MAG: helix-turn-helix domain-containing protein [Magnetococcales bacterium]|nr:helix-turn-helix domain-containing protein [Magnetococcales bacterium]
MDGKWTPKMVADQLEEAASTLYRLPEVRPAGYGSGWPQVIHDAMDVSDWEEPPLVRPGPPTADAIARMDESLEWLRWLGRDDVRLLWLRAERRPWKEISRAMGTCRTTVWTRWKEALLQIAVRLNIASEKKMFERRV